MFQSLRPRRRSRRWSQSKFSSPAASRRAGFALEPLEDRRMLTASFTFQEIMAGGVMYRSYNDAPAMVTVPTAEPAAANATGSFKIQLEKSPALLANTEASAAFDMAAAYLESIFFDPITIVVDANVSVLAPGILGQASSERVFFNYDQLRALMIADAQEGEEIVNQLPTLAQLQVEFPEDPLNPFSLFDALPNRATLKALGVPEASLTGTPSQYNPSVIRDMSISFSSEVAFDYDPTDGINPGQTDFVAVAIHELMHGMGFTSMVDFVDASITDPSVGRQIPINPLDMFRLRPGAGINDFTNAPRVMTPVGDAVFYDGGVYNPAEITSIPGLTVGDIPLSTGRANGDGNQASHWKSAAQTGVRIGIMNPSISPGQVGVVSPEDLRALGLIGWDLIQTVPPVSLSVTGFTDFEGDEGTTDFIFTVFASNSTVEPYTVEYTTVDGTAIAGSDYEATSGTLTFLPDGPLTQTVTVKVFGDTVVEPDETFILRLFNATEPATIAVAEAIGLILNDDVEVSIGDVTIYEGHEGTRDAVFPITAFGAVNRNITITYTTLNGTAQGGVDYLPRSGTVMLTPQQPSAFITVPIIGDRLNEGTETFQVVLTQSVGSQIAKGVGIGTILDDDPLPSFYVNDVQITTTAAGAFAAVFTVGLDAVSGRTVKVNFSTSDFGAQNGIDYAGISGQLTFDPGVLTRTVAVPIMTTAVYSADKKFHLNLSSPEHALLADPQGLATIVFATGPVGERIIDNGDSGYTRSNGWTTVTNTLSYGLDYDYHAAGNGNATANYTFTGLVSGSYEVYTKWIPFSNRATNAPYTILDGNAPVGTVLVNQQVGPSGDVSNGVVWHKLGTFSTTTGTLIVRLSNGANGFVVADAVRLVANGISSQSPEINVSGFGLSINSGDTTPSILDGTDFGQTNINWDSAVHAFTINNNGNAVLLLGGTPRVTISGTHAADFLVTAQPAASVHPNGETNFGILFRPTGEGLRQATVTIANNDSDEGPYTFAIQGTGVAVASPFAHNAALPPDVNADARVSSSDALLIVNHLLRDQVAQPLTAGAATQNVYLDVNNDGRVTTADLLMVINYLLQQSAAPQAEPAVAEPQAAESLVWFDDTAASADNEPAAAPLLLPASDSAAPTSGAPSAADQALWSAAVSAALADDDDGEDSWSPLFN